MTSVPKPDTDLEYRDELLSHFQEAFDRHPRGKQQMLGPSEIGGCPRGVAWKLAYGASDGRRSGYASAKGVIMHAFADKEVFANKKPRFSSDLKLPQVVPWIAGGTLDLHDSAPPPTIVDFKFPGDPSMEKARRGKPPFGYFAQINAYGLGALKAGLSVERVALLYMPMAGDDMYSARKGATLLTWPFDPQVAVDAMRAVKRIQDMLTVSTPDKVMAALPTAEDFCHSRACCTLNNDPRAICRGHRAGGILPVRNKDNVFE